MHGLNNFSAAEKEDEQLGRTSTTQAEEKEKDPERMDAMEEDKSLEEEGKDSKERSPSSTSEEQSESEFIEGIELEDIRKYVQCPICLGIIRKTRTVMGCLHRFCQECIDKSMRFGNHECPACRKHCASRRSLRPDPKFDAFIAATFGNVDSNEEQELEFDEDELARNKQIQASIAQVSQRQSEALVKSKSLDAPGVLPRSQPSGSGSRRRRNRRNMGHDTSQAAHVDDDGDNNRGRASSSAEPSAKIPPRKRKTRSATRSTAHPSSSSPPNNNDNCANNVTEEVHHRDCRETLSHGLAWGRGGTRSSARQGNNNQGASSSTSVRNARLNRLVEYLGSLESNSV